MRTSSADNAVNRFVYLRKGNATMFRDLRMLGHAAQRRAATRPAPGSGDQPTTQPITDAERTASTPRLWRHRRNAVIAAVVLLAVAAIGITAYSVSQPSPHATAPTPASRPTVLPLTGLSHPAGVAVDSAGDVYVTDGGNKQVVKLAAGSSTQTCCRSPASATPTAWRWIPLAACTSPTTTTTGW
jgi:DNA-binding beta-propeller fold protein YncE